MSMAEDVFDGIDWFLFGCIQILLIAIVLRTWERFAPAEKQERFAANSRADILHFVSSARHFPWPDFSRFVGIFLSD